MLQISTSSQMSECQKPKRKKEKMIFLFLLLLPSLGFGWEFSQSVLYGDSTLVWYRHRCINSTNGWSDYQLQTAASVIDTDHCDIVYIDQSDDSYAIASVSNQLVITFLPPNTSTNIGGCNGDRRIDITNSTIIVTLNQWLYPSEGSISIHQLVYAVRSQTEWTPLPIPWEEVYSTRPDCLQRGFPQLDHDWVEAVGWSWLLIIVATLHSIRYAHRSALLLIGGHILYTAVGVTQMSRSEWLIWTSSGIALGWIICSIPFVTKFLFSEYLQFRLPTIRRGVRWDWMFMYSTLLWLSVLLIYFIY